MSTRNIIKLQQRIFHRKFICNADYKSQFCTKGSEKDIKNNLTEVTKESLQWRRSWDQTEEWYSKLKVFASEKNNTDVIKFLQSDIDLRPSSIKKWYNRKKEETERHMQQYIPQRNQILGDNLAAAHFIVHRGGKVKFFGNDKWVKHDDNLEYSLPNKFVSHFVVEAIDCSDMNLYYEGLANLKGLTKLQRLSLNGCKNMDDWCIDRISGLLKDSIVHLDIRNCKNITYRGIGALYKTTKLQTLLVDSFTETKELEMTCLMLQELSPNLSIKTNE